ICVWSSEGAKPTSPVGPATPPTKSNACESRPNGVIVYGPSVAGGASLPGFASKTIAADAEAVPVRAKLARTARIRTRRRGRGIELGSLRSGVPAPEPSTGRVQIHDLRVELPRKP